LSLNVTHKKNSLKFGIITFCILISCMLFYVENKNLLAENKTVRGSKSDGHSASSKPDVSKDVNQIQTLLSLLKFNPGPIDGILGKRTTEAIRAFQLDIGVPVTGKIDANLKSQLDEAYRKSVLRVKELTQDDKEKPQVIKGKPKVTVSQDIKLFSEPDLKGILIGEAKQGTKFTAMCRTDKWFLVTTKDDRNCWLHESWMTADSQTSREVKALIDCESMKALKMLVAKRAKQLETEKASEVTRPTEIVKEPQKETTSNDIKTKTENPYLKYIKISFPIVAVIFLAYFYRIWTRLHEKKRNEKLPRKPKPDAAISEQAEPAEEYVELSEVQELERELTDHADLKPELDQQEPPDYQDPSHPGFITPVVRRKVWIRNKGQCAVCGSRENLQYGYIVPTSEGGNNTLDNLQLLCKSCNQEKSDK
jgi:5-methylcytosine-specific restriction endonuclease McrA